MLICRKIICAIVYLLKYIPYHNGGKYLVKSSNEVKKHKEYIKMKTVKNWMKAIMLFIILPIPVLYLDWVGKPRGEWNTWFLDGDTGAKRRYAGSVTLMLNIWAGIIFTTLAGLIIHLMCSMSLSFDSGYLRIIDVSMLALCLMWVVLLSPKIVLSYETWNWMKACKFLVRLHRSGISERDVLNSHVKNFLAIEFKLAGEKGEYHVFNHLEDVMRSLHMWNGRRSDLADAIK